MEGSLEYDYLFKYILVGDASVGKSALLSMFVNGAFLADSNPTMGVEFATKKILAGSHQIKVQIWDTVPPIPLRLGRSPSEPSLVPIIKTPSESFLYTISPTRPL